MYYLANGMKVNPLASVHTTINSHGLQKWHAVLCIVYMLDSISYSGHTTHKMLALLAVK